MPQTTQNTVVAWLLGLVTSALVVGLVAKINIASSPENDPANCLVRMNTPKTVSATTAMPAAMSVRMPRRARASSIP